MKADPVCVTETGIDPDGGSHRLPRKPWSPPVRTRLRAGLAESGPNINFDGVEGTS